jgi:hypothetical protein
MRWPKAVAKIVDDAPQLLLGFFDFPAEACVPSLHARRLATRDPGHAGCSARAFAALVDADE